MDHENEILIQEAINSLVKSRTLIIIAHRLSTITAADQILVIDKGKVIERGRHSELVSGGEIVQPVSGQVHEGKGVENCRVTGRDIKNNNIVLDQGES